LSFATGPIYFLQSIHLFAQHKTSCLQGSISRIVVIQNNAWLIKLRIVLGGCVCDERVPLPAASAQRADAFSRLIWPHRQTMSTKVVISSSQILRHVFLSSHESLWTLKCIDTDAGCLTRNAMKLWTKVRQHLCECDIVTLIITYCDIVTMIYTFFKNKTSIICRDTNKGVS